jgi:hypothetical protein
MTSTPQQLPHSLEAAHAAIISAQSVIATLSEKLYSLVQSAKLAGVEPWAYLKDVLDRLPNHPHSRIGELLPKQWAAARAAAEPPAAAAKA